MGERERSNEKNAYAIGIKIFRIFNCIKNSLILCKIIKENSQLHQLIKTMEHLSVSIL